MFPTVAGAEAIVVNLNEPDGKPLTQPVKFSPDVLANIFLGKITKWNDPTIASSNAGLNLAAKDILVVHRSDGSGTTFIFTNYLSEVSPDWKRCLPDYRLYLYPDVHGPAGLHESPKPGQVFQVGILYGWGQGRFYSRLRSFTSSC